MKTPDQVLQAIGKRVADHWHHDLAAEAASWPHAFAIGAVTKLELEADFPSFQRRTLQWRDWAAQRDLTLTTATRHVQGTSQQIPTHIAIPGLHAAATLLGTDWQQRIERGRNRLSVLQATFPDAGDLPKIVRAVDGYSDTDFELLCSAALWFQHNSASGLTPRQVPIEGLHAKWLNSRRQLVQDLAGIASLGLLPPHAARIHFTYLDPDYLAADHRRHDSAAVGDTAVPAYAPQIVIISENKDTAIGFPTLPGAISVEGDGFAGAEAIASFGWLSAAPCVVYWGDIDPSGFEIVNRFRQAGLQIRTILMDLTTFEAYERFGAATDAKGKPLGCPARKYLPHLTSSEQTLYEHLTDPAWPRVRRVEQERIPLTIALDAVTETARR